MTLLWVVLGWWLIGSVTTLLGSILFDKEVTVGGIIGAVVMGLFGPAILVFFAMVLVEKYEDTVLWKGKK